MPKLTFQPGNVKIDVRVGTTVLTAARKAGAPVRTRCGGMAGCLMCKVYAQPGAKLSKMEDKERRKLGPLADEGVRLACQARVEGDAEVKVPEDPLKEAVRRKLQQQEEDEWW